MKKKIDIKQLQLGMYVEELDRPWLETPFLFQGFRIESQMDLDALNNLCSYVYINEEKGDALDDKPVRHAVMPGSGRPTDVNARFENSQYHANPLLLVEEEVPKARAIQALARTSFESLFKEMRLGGTMNVEEVRHLVVEMIESITRNPEALLLLGRIEQKRNDAASHAINCGILALSYGRYIGLSDQALQELGLAVMLHDVGETAIPDQVLQHGLHKTAEEIRLFQRHTELGAKILAKIQGMPKCAVDVAYSHHERIDGKGYPRGIKGDEMSAHAKIAAIIDVYEWVTSAAAGQILSSTEAVHYLYRNRDTFFDKERTEQFIQCLGIYPIGSLVELARGDVGVVVSVSPDSHLFPRLLLVLDKDKLPYRPYRLINLSHFKSQEKIADYTIKKVLPGNAYGLDLHAVVLESKLAGH